VYRDAGMLDEAVHLYANVLGLPGEAAPLVARLGNAERAAELYEIAGMRPEAARAWAEVARALRRPEDVALRVVRLDPAVGLALLEDLARARPLAGEGVTIHFELAVLLADGGEVERARAIFGDIERAHGDYRDVAARLRALRGGRAAVTSQEPEALEVVVQPVIVGPGEEIDMARIAQEAAAAAVSRARRTSVRPGAIPQTRVQVTLNAAARGTMFTPGLEETPITAVLLQDNAVREAREGPSVAALTRFIKGTGCDLGNIEVFYRLGLAHLAGGDWDRALRCFEQVDEASPGYRDAGARASEVRRWREAMGARRTLVGAEGAAGRYELLGELGRGGMAVVYRAVDTVLDRVVALKFLNAESSANAEMREMFQREARSVAQLNHANIVTVYDFGTYTGRVFLAMEFVEGVTVEQLVQSEGRLGVVEALRITAQVLQALEYAHARKIIHRDVKPSNMMRSPAGVVKLMDFGLAKSIEKGDKASLIAGTPAYMPPEQLYGRRVDHRADLYATAASLYEMLSGRLPFESMDRTDLPPPLRALHPEVPEVIERVIVRGLSVDPEQRMASAAEFAASLQRVLDSVERGSLRPPPGAPSGVVIPSLPAPSAALAGLVPAETAVAPKETAEVRNQTVRFGAPRR
jgi:tetratricopeptide (TPR) repeat protein